MTPVNARLYRVLERLAPSLVGGFILVCLGVPALLFTFTIVGEWRNLPAWGIGTIEVIAALWATYAVLLMLSLLITEDKNLQGLLTLGLGMLLGALGGVATDVWETYARSGELKVSANVIALAVVGMTGLGSIVALFAILSGVAEKVTGEAITTLRKKMFHTS